MGTVGGLPDIPQYNRMEQTKHVKPPGNPLTNRVNGNVNKVAGAFTTDTSARRASLNRRGSIGAPGRSGGKENQASNVFGNAMKRLYRNFSEEETGMLRERKPPKNFDDVQTSSEIKSRRLRYSDDESSSGG